MLITKFVTEDRELEEIKALAEANLPDQVPDELKATEGYVTFVYTLETLRDFQKVTPSIVVKDGDRVIAYMLILINESARYHEGVKDMVNFIDTLSYHNKKISEYKIYYLGQACVAHDYRGKGVLKQIFQFHREHLAPIYDLAATAISARNVRSQKAHEAYGGFTIATLPEDDDVWNILLWDWRAA